MDQFDAPASGVKITEFEGALLLLRPTHEEKDILTKFGPADAITAEVVVLDGPQAGDYSDVRVFQRALQGQLRSKIGTGRYVLGRLGRGEGKAGQSPPWILSDPTEADKKLARAHLERPAADNRFEDKIPF